MIISIHGSICSANPLYVCTTFVQLHYCKPAAEKLCTGPVRILHGTYLQSTNFS